MAGLFTLMTDTDMIHEMVKEKTEDWRFFQLSFTAVLALHTRFLMRFQSFLFFGIVIGSRSAYRLTGAPPNRMPKRCATSLQ